MNDAEMILFVFFCGLFLFLSVCGLAILGIDKLLGFIRKKGEDDDV